MAVNWKKRSANFDGGVFRRGLTLIASGFAFGFAVANLLWMFFLARDRAASQVSGNTSLMIAVTAFIAVAVALIIAVIMLMRSIWFLRRE